MKNTKLKYVSLALVGSMLFTDAFSFAYASTSVSTTSSISALSSYVGTSEVDKTILKYESDLLKSNNSTKLESLYSQKSKIKSGELSEELKDDIVNSTLSGVTVKTFAKKTDKFYNTLVGSMYDTKKSSYKFFVKTSLTTDELKTTFNYFDKAEITLVSTNTDGTNNYQILFLKSSRFAKKLASYVTSGTVPSDLLPGVEVILPFVVNSTADSVYLSGESLTADWGIAKLGAQDYQKYLSTKTKIKVGVIDTGINTSHQDLAANIYTNTGEVAGDGIDNDGNGYIDDVHGYNFVSGTNNAEDDHSHGSHVSGIIGASVNAKGIFGVDSNVSLVPLKVLDASGYGSSYGIISALNYAANNGIKVVNLSLGGDGTPSTDAMCSTITQVKAKGVITVVAAGNENADVSAKVPAGCSDAITVGAVDSSLTKASFSNYGTEVDVAAPGVSIYSSVLNNSYATWNGTSMATPFVTGLVASMLQVNPNLTYSDIKSNLVNNGVTVNSSVNIGKFVSMSNVMTSLGVSADVTSTGGTSTGTTSTGTTNVLPTVILTATKVSTNNYNLTVSASDSDGTIVSSVLYKDGVVYGTGTSFNVTLTADTTFKVVVTDDAGGQADKSVSLTYEAPTTDTGSTNVLPTVSLTSTKVSTNNYNLTVAASDSDGTIVSSVLYKDGVVYGTGTSFNVTLTANAIFKVVVTDDVGGQADSSVSLTYEAPSTSTGNVLPTVSLTGVRLSQNYYNIQISASDTDGKIVSVLTYANGKLLTKSTNFNYKITKDIVLKTIVKDNSGATADSSITLSYENYLPKVVLSTSKLGTNKYKVTARATDSDGKIVSSQIYANDVLVGSGYTYSATITSETVVKIVVTDNLGGVTEASTTLAYVDTSANVAPTVSFTNGTYNSKLGKLVINAKDTDGKVSNLKLYVNGKQYYNYSTNGASLNLTLYYAKGTSMTIKVVATDDTGATGENSITVK